MYQQSTWGRDNLVLLLGEKGIKEGLRRSVNVMGHYTKPCSSLKSSPTWVLPIFVRMSVGSLSYPYLKSDKYKPNDSKVHCLSSHKHHILGFYQNNAGNYLHCRIEIIKTIYIVCENKVFHRINISDKRNYKKKKGIIEILNRQCMQYYKMRLRAVCVLNCYKLADCLFTCSPGRCSGQSKI